MLCSALPLRSAWACFRRIILLLTRDISLNMLASLASRFSEFWCSLEPAERHEIVRTVLDS